MIPPSWDTFNTPSFPTKTDYNNSEQDANSHNTLETNLIAYSEETERMLDEIYSLERRFNRNYGER